MTRQALPTLLLVLSITTIATACRKSDNNSAGISIVPSSFGSNGCTGPEQAFTQPKTSLAALGIPFDGVSQLTAAGDAELLFATASGARVFQIDVTGAPLVTSLVDDGIVAALLASMGIAQPPSLSGIAVLDAESLLVMEHTSNTVLRVSRTTPDTVVLFAGQPDLLGGFADGLAIPGSGPGGPARFHFLAPSQLAPAGGGAVFLLDPGNHALRRIAGGFVTTLAGTGAAFFNDGSLSSAGFDTPSGLTLTCTGTVLVTELGQAGAGGHRLRRLTIGQTTFFGTSGQATTLAGDGAAATVQGLGPEASLHAPVSPLSTTGEEVYWIDSGSGVLRRLAAGDLADCPLWVDCAAALVGGGDFTPGGTLSLTQTPSGTLYALDALAGVVYSLGP